MQKSVLLIGVIAVLAGCTSPRQMAIMGHGAPTIKVEQVPDFTIEPGDVLQVSFSAINAEAVAPYNSAGVCRVRANGEVSLPVIGTIVLSGKNIREAQDTLQMIVRQQVREAIAQVVVTNASVTILGEVHQPAALSIAQPIPILQAIGRVGGLTHNAKCKDILVQRTEQGVLHNYHINLLTTDFCLSPCYFLTKGDVVIVSPLHVTSACTVR